MKEIILNKGKLKDEELTDVLEKARIVLRNDKDTVKRELMEETTINILLDDIEPFAVVYNYLRDYEIEDGSLVNRLVKTYYFSGYTTDDTIEYFNLTKNEKEDNLRGFFIDMEEGIELLQDYNKENPRAVYLALETLKVLEEYKDLKNEEE